MTLKKILMVWTVLGLGYSTALFALEKGMVLTPVVLSGENGGDSSEKAWHSEALKGKVHVLLYMDPDERKAVMPFLDKLNTAQFPSVSYSTVAVVNLAATWMPNAVLEAILAKKQKELHNTFFVFDKTKQLVKKWKMEDDASNIVVLDRDMKVLYSKSGTPSAKEQAKILTLLKQTIEE